jgi:SAM-dependent methyltransferase
MTDPYALSAEFYEVLAREQRQPVLEALRAVLGSLEATTGPVVDLGAGTGMATLVIADALPDAELVAIEPSPAMRTALLTRLAERPQLRQRVTVLPWGFPGAEAELPDRLRAVVGLAMLGHLDPNARARLWRLLAERLEPGGVAVFELQAPPRPQIIPETTYTRTRLGALEYEGSFAAQPSGPLTMDWTMRWRIYRGERLLQEHAGQHTQWWTISEADVAAEAGGAGLTCTAAGEGLLVLRVSSAA